jgi:hypothetical protein
MNFYLKRLPDGRVCLDKEPPKELTEALKVIAAPTWIEARDSLIVNDLDPKYVEGLTYKQGYGYF